MNDLINSIEVGTALTIIASILFILAFRKEFRKK
jgi:hypothetical protein